MQQVSANTMVLPKLKEKVPSFWSMLSWWTMYRSHHRNRRGRFRSVSFKKYVDFITYDKELLLTMLVSIFFSLSQLIVCWMSGFRLEEYLSLQIRSQPAACLSLLFGVHRQWNGAYSGLLQLGRHFLYFSR